jgi:hypothetical protein
MNMCLARFTYDERGQRLLKKSNDGLGSVAQRTYCLRDASGGEQYVLVQDDTQSTTSEQLPIRPPGLGVYKRLTQRTLITLPIPSFRQ